MAALLRWTRLRLRPCADGMGVDHRLWRPSRHAPNSPVWRRCARMGAAGVANGMVMGGRSSVSHAARVDRDHAPETSPSWPHHGPGMITAPHVARGSYTDLQEVDCPRTGPTRGRAVGRYSRLVSSSVRARSPGLDPTAPSRGAVAGSGIAWAWR